MGKKTTLVKTARENKTKKDFFNVKKSTQKKPKAVKTNVKKVCLRVNNK